MQCLLPDLVIRDEHNFTEQTIPLLTNPTTGNFRNVVHNCDFDWGDGKMRERLAICQHPKDSDVELNFGRLVSQSPGQRPFLAESLEGRTMARMAAIAAH